MNKQKVFKFKFEKNENFHDFYVNKTNVNAYNGIIENKNKNILLIGPKKSGKTYLSDIWIQKNNAIKLNNNFNQIINNSYNIIIDNINKNYNEEELFHILNHCKFNNSKILITSNLEINEINFVLKDLISRLKTFTYLKINQPDDDMLTKILTKLFIKKQFVINSNEVFQYILKNANRSYLNIFNIVNKLDYLSLEKKRQLTIPLIKEIL